LNVLYAVAKVSLIVTLIKYIPISSIRVGAIATDDQVESVRRVPSGRLTSAAPSNELVAVIVRGFPSSSTKKDERS
jgi:hypothetical protein